MFYNSVDRDNIYLASACCFLVAAVKVPSCPAFALPFISPILLLLFST